MEQETSEAVDVESDPEEPPHHIYRSDSLRLLSYANWPNASISRESLALAGFYYIGGVQGENSDKVKCAWCGGEIENWISGHCPITEHVKHFPNCQFAKEMANRNRITVSQFSNDDLLSHNNMSELGIQTHKPPIQPKYSTIKSRLDTFGRWPTNHPQKPESLATAGFYYGGQNDQVRCFHCDIGLCRWEPNDNPWVEHAKWFPECGFLNLIKKREFIDECVNNRTDAQSVQRRVESVRVRNPVVRVVTEADVEHCMGSPCAMVALSCGLQPERIRRAIRSKLRRTGVPFNCPNNLIEAALNDQVNETPFSIPEWRPPTQCASSSSSHFPVDDAAIDQVTRMIINSALTDDSLEVPHSPLTSSTNSIESENTTNDEIVEHLDNIETIHESNDVSHSVDEQAIERILVTDESLDDSNIILTSEEIQNIEMNNSSATSLEEENKLLRDARTCKICLDAEVSVVFLPCGHLVSCIICATGLLQCPICRGNIKGIVRTYLS